MVVSGETRGIVNKKIETPSQSADIKYGIYIYKFIKSCCFQYKRKKKSVV